jgi:hypothetical protein
VNDAKVKSAAASNSKRDALLTTQVAGPSARPSAGSSARTCASSCSAAGSATARRPIASTSATVACASSREVP